MANDHGTRKGPSQEALLARKLELMKEVFEATQRELLLVDLELLSPILESKEALFTEIVRIDGELAQTERQGGRQSSLEQELAEVVSAILENEKTLETRIQEEQSRLREELRDVGRQTRLRQYLDRLSSPGGRINVKK
ncbi:MAG: hypothetical protein IIA14_05540 [SAR324 cluster bacterium]|nr:hypothetical protein [SAR324 cluster bacterium]